MSNEKENSFDHLPFLIAHCRGNVAENLIEAGEIKGIRLGQKLESASQ